VILAFPITLPPRKVILAHEFMTVA